MSAIVIDASVAVKWFLAEEHSPAARRVLRGRWTLLAPDLIWAEVGNALWKRCQRAELTVEVAQGILRDFRHFPLQTYPAKTLIEAGWILAVQHRITVYDALYLAAALARECKLVTSNRVFFDTIRRSSFASHAVWVEDVQ